MPAAPSFADLAASGNLKGTVRPALGALREYTTGVLAVDGTIATALATLGALGGQYLLRTTAYSVTSADRGRVIDTTGTWTLSLLAAASAVAGFSVVLRNLGTGTITIDPNGSETVDGVTTLAIGPGRAGIVICTGTAWLTVGLTASAAGLTAAGTAALPGMAGVGDADTGLSWLGAAVLALSAGGAERARVTSAGMQVTGLISGTAVTQTATDTTANRLLKVGDFGLGAAKPPALTDLTAAIMPGQYHIVDLATATGVPAGLTGRGTLVVTRADGGRGWFILALPVASLASQRHFFGSRSIATGAITWVRAITDNEIVGTVSQTAGVPTGSLGQFGSSANGNFERRASGQAVCTRTDQTTPNASTAYGSLFRSADIVWTFPTAFFAGTLPAVAFSADNADVLGFRVISLSNTAVTFQLVANASIATTTTVRASAMGRWSDMA